MRIRPALWRKLALVFSLALLVPLLALPKDTEAADPPTYYKETGHYLGNSFRDYWQKNGGLYVFGYPITEEYVAANGRVTQWFERTRFELFPEYANTPFLVQLGLLGIESTAGRVFPQTPPRANDANHRYFAETHHLVMWGFKTIWESRGGLPIYGYPISEEMMEILPADGKWHVVQYFERARFEYWPDFKPGERVLISDLGRRQAPRELVAPLPPGTPPGTVPPGATPAPGQPGQPGQPVAPPSVNATVTPPVGPQGTVFAFNAFNFQPGEEVSIWATAPDQAVLPADFIPTADDDGSLTSAEIAFGSNGNTPTGVWAITAQGNRSGNVAIGYFVITGNQPPPPPSTPGLPDNKNARVEPREGPQGTVFFFFANGFVPGEAVLVTLLNGKNEIVANVLELPADPNGSIDYAQIRLNSNRNLPPDVYRLYALGESDREAYAYLRVTPASTASLGYQLLANGANVKRDELELGIFSNLTK